MENQSTYSTTQVSNITVFAGAVVMLIAKGPTLLHPTLLTADDLTSIIVSAGIIIATVVSFVNRYKKGDLTLGGKRKY